ncbi:MAG TPA: bifunctional DNA-binding transcriptional regulator/O6-methylguanine-DNA methyltransferase Ada [Acidobacteria bacterium]|nr:bifunctional DNA-binding transcriptional regulator/O6-methylguanine-DNA methyltransferase Ada [Acidobacteriota bacterium]
MMDETSAWDAVLERDARRDGQFVYAVATTGVYCRPSCPSRRPRRANVRFFALPEDAERAGFRACRRCRPQEKAAPDAHLVERACAYLDAHLDEAVTLEALGAAIGVSPWHLQRTFKRVTGVSPKEMLRARRMERLKDRLQQGDDVAAATYEAGFGSGSRVYERSDARLGMTPATYRRGGAGMRIRFATTECPLGRLLVAVTDRGVCAVTLGDSDEGLVAGLAREYPRAALEPAEAGAADLSSRIEAVLGYLEGTSPHLALPLDVQATAFQERVWKALQEIPSGTTRTYGEVAAALGQPQAARAVAGACAANPVALVIPCHRVVRGDGDSGGYRWGTERKSRLLAGERARRSGTA